MEQAGSGREFYAGLLEALAGVMGCAKGYLRDHGPRVGLLAHRLARELGLDDCERSELVFAAVLSDIGMVGLAEEAWENPVPELPDEVRRRVRLHPERSEKRVRGIPHLEAVGDLVRVHHEWWNGGGYPDGLRGPDIPRAARILRLADTVTALASPRPHRLPVGRGEIEELVSTSTGAEFGPEEAAAWRALNEAEQSPRLDRGAWREVVVNATHHLIPEDVSPLSTNQLLTIIADLVNAKDPYTGGHSPRVALLAVSVADQMGIADHVKSALWASGFLRDLGKLAVPLRILAKGGRLTDEEFGYIRAHPGDGADILEEIPTLRHLTDRVRHHHERWDGRGYPGRIAAEEIPLVARIMAVCDS